ncbi:glycosyltransferase family 9 protein [Daejeonella lutea]|uniref:ADP-heptose:LPS heptosyltransferase n=1 Tax=Daejeonella lutea TaxID=572036 RepID=A0A1T5AVG2_9SPHI|nr:glycosyltransferase family 9 protein [Daejeonella lutea]SKB38799.1 ADP-heptose:LPS heptosyltransferase [Daejeonella lutea]
MKTGNLKILIIRFSSIGDIVLTTPVIRCVKEQLSSVEVHYLTKKAFEPVLSANPYIDKIHFLKDSLSETVADLKLENFDHVIDLHHNIRTLYIKRSLGKPVSSFNKLNWQKWLLVRIKVNFLPNEHIVDRYLKTVEFLGVKNDEKGLDYFLLNNHNLSLLLPPSHHQYIALVIGAQHATKRLPTDKLIELCQLLKHPVVLLGGPEDTERGEQIATAGGDHVFNGCGKFKLDQSAFLVKMSASVITHDTGLMHIAAAFKKTIHSVWGNTVPEFGMYPYMAEESKIHEVKGLSCRPCSKIGYQKCPLGHFNCMNKIDLITISQQAHA